jgi:hypothetical protein
MDLQPNRRGIDNNRTKEAGMPSSGGMSAAGGLLPAQRQQQPFEGVGNQPPMASPKPAAGGGGAANGTINGGAVQGAQFKTTAQPMSPGVASYLSIPSQQFMAPQAQATGTMLPARQMQQGPMQLNMQQGPVAFKADQPTPNFGKPLPNSPQQTTEQYPAATPPPVTTDQTTTQAAWDPRGEIDKIRSFYNEGGAWDANTRLALQNQMAGNSRSQMLRDALAGRGSNLGQIASDRSNLDTMTSYEAQRGQLQNQAQQDAYGREMQYAEMLNKTKIDLIRLAGELNIGFDDADFNTMAKEVLTQFGANAGPGSLVEIIDKGTAKNASPYAKLTSGQVLDKIKQYWTQDTFAMQDEEAGVAFVEGLSNAQLKELYNRPDGREWLAKALDDSWGDDWDRLAAKLQEAGIPILEY